jgi:hypothetical protein
MRQSKRARSIDPAMTGNDIMIIVDQDRIGEAKASDAIGNLPDLLLAMRPWVVLVRLQFCKRHLCPAPCGKSCHVVQLHLHQKEAIKCQTLALFSFIAMRGGFLCAESWFNIDRPVPSL